MRISNLKNKAVAYLLVALMVVGTIAIAPAAYAYVNGKPAAGTTEIAEKSLVILKKGAIKADTKEDISNLWHALGFEFTVSGIDKEAGTVDINYNLEFKKLKEYGFNSKNIVALLKEFGVDLSKYELAITIGGALLDSVLETLSIPVKYTVSLDDVTLVRNGINSTPQELKYIGKKAHIVKDSVDVDGKEISNVFCLLNFDITTVVDTVAHLQCRVTPGYLEQNGLTKEAFANAVGLEPDNGVFGVLWQVLTTSGYTFNFDVDIERLSVDGIPSDTETETETETETGTETDTTTDTSTNTESEQKALYGDVNCDGFVNMEDVTSLQKIMANLTTHQSYGAWSQDNSDANHDFKVNMEDVTTIQKYLAHLISTLDKVR